ncbi:MAG: cadherin domain-containing protein [Pirellulaceae bacterium]
MRFQRSGSTPHKRHTRKSQRWLRAEMLEARRVLAAAIDSTIWLDVADESVSMDQAQVRATEFDVFQLDRTTLESFLETAPLLVATPAPQQPTLAVPVPDGSFLNFRFGDSPIMAPELAAKFPEINTYAGQGIEDPSATIRFDLTPAGFHAQVLSANGNFYVDPLHDGSSLYAVYYAAGTFDLSDLKDLEHEDHDDVVHIAGRGDASTGPSTPNAGGIASRSGTELRTYRTAVAATGEYTTFHGGTVASGQAAIVTAMNRVTGIYETELSIAFELVANNDVLVFTDANSDPYTNNNGVAMLGENQTVVDARIGNANYDIGHVFSTGGGGVAALGSVGINGIKAQGVTGLPAPVNDVFYVDYVSHEMGHQFGGNHTFNADSGSCAGNINPSTAMEPGSGSTIQAYAGICGNDDLQPNSDAYFHSISFDEMIAHVDQRIPNVGSRRLTGNSIPFVSAGSDYIIPAGTPFVLTANGIDADVGQQLTYNWEQRDLGPQQDVNAGDNGASPLFRSWTATVENTRYFPRLQDLATATKTIGETLPTTNRTLNFRVTVRDNNVGGGGVNTDDTQVQVVNTGTPFAVTSPNTAVTWDGLSQQTVTWDVAGTTAAPISADEVSIYFSIDGGLTYPLTIAENLPNTGTADVFVPNVDTTTGRVMVRAADNIFFDISDQDITVVGIPIDIQLDSGSALYVEDTPAIAVSPGATVLTAGNLAGLTIDISISSGREAGDQLSILSGPITTAGGNLLHNGTMIGSISQTGGDYAIRLNPNSTGAATQDLVRSIGFRHTTDAPTSAPRTIDFVFGGVNVQSRVVDVLPVNDSPVLANATISSILEDTPVPAGSRVSDVLASQFNDPDIGSSLAGVVIVNNPQIGSQGVWYFSDDGVSWVPISDVDDASLSLVVAADAWIGFSPAPDYFGIPDPLRIRGLDDTYAGQFSNATSGPLVFLDPLLLVPDGPVSTATSRLGIAVQNVNDAPFATQTLLPIDLLQDEAIDQVFSASLFGDIDSPVLDYSVHAANGGQVPTWLTFDPATRMISGTPRNRDVGVYNLILRATDSALASAEIPMIITVTNVNDAPTDLRLVGNTVPENRTNFVVGELFATDPDPGDVITWASSDTRFIVRDGALILAGALDYEAEQTVNLVLTARDTGSPTEQSELNVSIKVVDENEFFPQLEGATFSITEGTPAGTVLRTLTAPDGDTLQTVKYRLKSGDVNHFAVDELTGDLTLTQPADLAVKSSYLVFVEAYDDGRPLKARTSQFIINVIPVNDFAPTMSTNQNLTLVENRPAGTSLGNIVAVDLDGEPLSYRLFDLGTEYADWLTIDPSTGEVKTTHTAAFDFESNETYVFGVEAQETVEPFRTVVGSLTVLVTDANDPPTAISAFSIPTAQYGYPTTSGFTVEDQDQASSYSLATTDARFEIRDGALALRSDFFFADSLAGTTTSLLVTVTDADDPSSSAELPVTINITANPSPWQNPILNVNVDRIGGVTGADVLSVINAINLSKGETALSRPRTLAEYALPDVDVNGDNLLTGTDALLVVNYINANPPSGEGEMSVEPLVPAVTSSVTPQAWLSAFTALEEEVKRRRG